jgi:hypothetical protein
VSPRAGAALALLLGGAAVIAATVLGASSTVLDSIVQPAPIIRAALVGGSVAIGILLLGRSLERLGAGASNVPGLIRGVRLVFLALAAFAAAGGWALGHPLPLLVALVIAGIDVVETSFLLLVIGPDRR